MSNILTIAKYELKRLFRDWRLVVMVLSQPIVIALIVGVVANHEPKNIDVLYLNQSSNKYADQFINELKKDDSLALHSTDNFDDRDIRENEARAIVRIDIKQDGASWDGKIDVKVDPSGSLAMIIAKQKISEAASAVAKEMARENVQAELSRKSEELEKSIPIPLSKGTLELNIDGDSYDPLAIDFKDGTEMKIKYFDYYGSSMMVVLVLMVVLNISGISITSERVSGTFERMTVTPYRKKDIILGKAMALFLIGLAVNLLGIVSLYTIYGISLGNMYLLGLITILVVGTAVGLGLFVSSITRTVVESVEAAMYVFFVSFLACGILLPIESAYTYFASLMKFLPFYHMVSASRSINMLGAQWADVSSHVIIIFVWMIVFLVLAVASLRREAK